MVPLESEPCPVMLARQRSRAALAFASVAFVAVGAIAWIGLDATRAPMNPNLTVSAAPPPSNAQQVTTAAISPPTSETEAAPIAELAEPIAVEPREPAVEVAQVDTVPEVDTPQPTTLAEAPVPELDAELEEIRFLAVEAGLQPDIAPAPEDFKTVEDVSEAPVTVASELSCVDELRSLAAANTIRFGVGSANLEVAQLSALRAFGLKTVACPEAQIHVTGHSDSSGDDLVNLSLSWKRADNAVAALASLGIDTGQFEAVGFGARSPAAQGDSSDEELNRRVEFVVLEAHGG